MARRIKVERYSGDIVEVEITGSAEDEYKQLPKLASRWYKAGPAYGIDADVYGCNYALTYGISWLLNTVEHELGIQPPKKITDLTSVPAIEFQRPGLLRESGLLLSMVKHVTETMERIVTEGEPCDFVRLPWYPEAPAILHDEHSETDYVVFETFDMRPRRVCVNADLLRWAGCVLRPGPEADNYEYTCRTDGKYMVVDVHNKRYMTTRRSIIASMTPYGFESDGWQFVRVLDEIEEASHA